MEKCYVENLAMIVTDRCNLDCAHCLRGKKCNRDMSDEVLESTLSQIRSIGNLAINGREHTLIKRPSYALNYKTPIHYKIESGF